MIGRVPCCSSLVGRYRSDWFISLVHLADRLANLSLGYTLWDRLSLPVYSRESLVEILSMAYSVTSSSMNSDEMRSDFSESFGGNFYSVKYTNFQIKNCGWAFSLVSEKNFHDRYVCTMKIIENTENTALSAEWNSLAFRVSNESCPIFEASTTGEL